MIYVYMYFLMNWYLFSCYQRHHIVIYPLFMYVNLFP